MIARKHWVRAGAASALVGGAFVAIAAVAQTPPAPTQPDALPDCQQATAAERPECAPRLSSSAEQADPNSQDNTPDPNATDQPPTRAKDDDEEEEENATRPPDDDEDQADQEDQDDQKDQQDAPPPDTSSDADSASDSQDPPQQR
jgi:hypothetical protein